MISEIKIYEKTDISINSKEILRYCGMKTDDENFKCLLNECLEECENAFDFKVCFIKTPLEINGDICDFSEFKLQSQNLSFNLKDCDSAIIFGATIGIKIDRLIARYSSLSPTKAVIFGAIGAMMIEALCDRFCSDIGNGRKTAPRFSAGYGDLALEAQKDIFKALDLQKKSGIYLNDSLLMVPTKSVTAIMGIKREGI